METARFIIELLIVLGAIVMGTRSSGVGLGLWGGTGVVLLVFVMGLPVGSPPVDALLIILSVIVASSMMQVAGGIDWMVSIAAKLISKNPKAITFVAPVVSFLFAVGAGTSNILYPLLPVIQDLSYRNGIRPSRPLPSPLAVRRGNRRCAGLFAGIRGDGGNGDADGREPLQL